MSSSEPCPRPGAKDTSCTLLPCRALARAEPPQLRSSSGCKRYILNALLMLRTSECKRCTLKVTCRLNVRAHSSSSLPLQNAAYASASTRALCAPQRAHNAVSFCQCALPCDRLARRFGGRSLPPQLQRVLTLSPPRVGRFPCAPLRTTRDAAPSPSRRARSLRDCEFFHLPPLSASQTKMRCVQRPCLPTAAALPVSKKWVCTEIASLLSRATNVLRLDKVSSLTDV
jgi:hypothetical protein